MKFRSIVKFITISLFEYTAHGIKSLTILAIAYFINSLDGQTCGRERVELVFL